MKLEQFLNRMIPENTEKKIPCFSNLISLNTLMLTLNSFEEIESILNEMDITLNELDIGIQLKWLRKKNLKVFKELELKVIEAYFSHPYVIQKITAGNATLFPHAKVLSDINFDLLEPVICLNERIFTDGQ
jgi:hypothetical protein